MRAPLWMSMRPRSYMLGGRVICEVEVRLRRGWQLAVVPLVLRNMTVRPRILWPLVVLRAYWLSLLAVFGRGPLADPEV